MEPSSTNGPHDGEHSTIALGSDLSDSSQKKTLAPQPETKDDKRKDTVLFWYFFVLFVVGLLLVGLTLIIFFEAVLPDLTQRVIDKATLQMDAVTLGEATEEGFVLDIESRLLRDRAFTAYMHDTELSVYVPSEETVGRRLSPEDGSRSVRREGSATTESSEMFLGTLEIPATELKGMESPLVINQVFQYSEDAFDSFARRLVQKGHSSWHIKGTTVVTIFGKEVRGLKFDKTVEIKGPNFMIPSGEERSSTAHAPRIVDMNTGTARDGASGVGIDVTLRIFNGGKVTMASLGEMTFDLAYDGLTLGTIISKDTAIEPGYNDLEFTGVIDILERVSRAGLFAKMAMLAKLNDLYAIYSRGDPVPVEAVGVGCSNPLFAEAVRTIRLNLPIEDLNLDFLAGELEDDTEVSMDLGQNDDFISEEFEPDYIDMEELSPMEDPYYVEEPEVVPEDEIVFEA